MLAPAPLAAALIGMTAFAQAHMLMKYPYAWGSEEIPASPRNYNLNAPHSSPKCNGQLADIVAADSVIEFTQGQTATATISGNAFHGGGSCQFSLLSASGEFKVITSIQGNCPISGGDTKYDFTIPADWPSGPTVFSWSWNNKIGNREWYQNCSPVMIKSGGSAARRSLSRRATAPTSELATMFIANTGNGCRVPEGKSVKYPDPGPPQTVKTNVGEGELLEPEGDCGSSSSSKGPSGPEEPSAPQNPPSAPQNPPSAPQNPPSAPQNPPSAPQNPPSGPQPPTKPPKSCKPQTPAQLPSSPISKPNDSVSSNDDAKNPAPPANDSPVNAPADMPALNGVQPVGTPCQGDFWNCVDNKFQRCGSGMWSAMISMSAGTTCKNGVTESRLETGLSA